MSYRTMFGAVVLVLGTAGVSWAQAPAAPQGAQGARGGQPQTIPPGYAGRTQINEPGRAPSMKSVELGPSVRNFNLNFSRGDDPIAGLAEFAEKNHLTDCRFTAIGAFETATLGWFDIKVGAYKKIEVTTPGEVVAMAGSIRMQNGKPFVHSHAVIALSDGTTRAGHIIDAKISLSLEVYLTAGEPRPGQ